jgi:glycosidase
LIYATSLTSPLASSLERSNAERHSSGLDRDLIYFVMPDRYKDGDLSNDNLPGYDPSATAFYHGGDLRGLIGNCEEGDDGLARIKALGFTALWLTPLVTQSPPTKEGAGYHGYWGTDFLTVNPHLGSEADMVELSRCAKKLNLKLILDVVTNHTGDIIRYEGRTPYIPEGFQAIKNPSWLNKLENYHNFGDISRCWSEGSCQRDGDFYGLDDLATEREEVYRGWADVYGEWIKKYGFEGFRVDTARHLDRDFFKNWNPLINQSAEVAGIENFTIFGEVWETSPLYLVEFVRTLKMNAALDFPFQRVATDFASGGSGAKVLRTLFSYDDYYTSENSHANSMVTFLGNHDMGRIGFLLSRSGKVKEKELLARVKLAHSLMYLSRGIPTVYYGDEVGMTGTGNGNDQLARQNMFKTSIEFWKNEPRIGSKPIGEANSFDRDSNHPISKHLRELAQLRANHPALANAMMQIRPASNGIFALSKRDFTTNREYVVLFNNKARSVTTSLETASPSGWKIILGSSQSVKSGKKLTITLPPISTTVLRADKSISESSFTLESLKAKVDAATGFQRITAEIESKDLIQVDFYLHEKGVKRYLGSDYNSPYRYFIDSEEMNGELEISARAINSKGESREFAPIRVTSP